jgi:hypothetical protein
MLVLRLASDATVGSIGSANKSSAWQNTSPAFVAQCHGARTKSGPRGGGWLSCFVHYRCHAASIVCSTDAPNRGVRAASLVCMRETGPVERVFVLKSTGNVDIDNYFVEEISKRTFKPLKRPNASVRSLADVAVFPSLIS